MNCAATGKSVCKTLNVRFLPTVRVFHDGKPLGDYNGERKEGSFFPLCYVDCVIGDFGRLLPSRYLCVFGGERRLGVRLRSARSHGKVRDLARLNLNSNFLSPQKHINSDWVRVWGIPIKIAIIEK